jgi:hypothetical protein
MAVIGKYTKSFDIQDRHGMERVLTLTLPDSVNIGFIFGYNNATARHRVDYLIDIDIAKDLRDTLTELIGDKEA